MDPKIDVNIRAKLPAKTLYFLGEKDVFCISSSKILTWHLFLLNCNLRKMNTRLNKQTIFKLHDIVHIYLYMYTCVYVNICFSFLQENNEAL